MIFDLQRFGQVLTYDPKKVTVSFGTHQITGFSEDDFLSLEPSGEGVQKVTGVDGEVGRSLDPNETFHITIHLASTSKSNKHLSEVYNLDKKTGRGMYDFMIKDLSGSTLFHAEQAWIINFPSADMGKTISTYDWEFDTGKVEDPIIGGAEGDDN